MQINESLKQESAKHTTCKRVDCVVVHFISDACVQDLGGVLWLARMAAKAQLSQDRLLRADTAFPCKRDSELLEKIYPGGVKSIEDKARDFQSIVITSDSYDTVWTRLKQTCSPAVITSLAAVRFSSLDRKKKHGDKDGLVLHDHTRQLAGYEMC